MTLSKISPKELACNWFSIPEHLSARYFQHYYLKYWQGKYILSNTHDGLLMDTFIIHYHEITRGYILANPKEQYACSFRVLKPELGLLPRVIIAKGNI